MINSCVKYKNIHNIPDFTNVHSYEIIYKLRSYNPLVFSNFWLTIKKCLTAIRSTFVKHKTFQWQNISQKTIFLKNSSGFKAANIVFKRVNPKILCEVPLIYGLNAPILKYRVKALPIRTKKFTLLKSAHVHKNARNQFEIQSQSATYHLYVDQRSIYHFISIINNRFLKEYLPVNLELTIKEIKNGKIQLD